MTKSKQNFILASMVIVIIAIGLSRCKSVEETEAAETETSADTSIVAEIADTSVLSATRQPLTVIIENLKSVTAPVYISIYGTKSKFPAPKGQLKEYKFTPDGKVLTAKIPDLKFGTYALATYQDENSSGAIDKNFIGMPTEGFGFSNNYKPKVKAPAFKDCSFAYNEKSNSVTISMIQ